MIEVFSPNLPALQITATPRQPQGRPALSAKQDKRCHRRACHNLHGRPDISALHSRIARWPGGTASASREADLGSIPALAVRHFFSRSSHTSDLKIGTLVATVSGV